MKNRVTWKVFAISVVLVMVLSCVPPCIAVGNLTNDASNRSDTNSIEIMSDYEVTFNMSSTCVIGTDLVVKGESTGGNTVDIAFENVMVAVDVPIEDGKFEKAFPTGPEMCPSTIIIKAYVNGPKDRYGNPVNVSVGERIPEGLGIVDDGRTVVLMTMPYLTVNQSSDLVQIGDSYTINGTAPGSKYVYVIIISPKGGYDIGIDGGYGVTLYNLSVSKVDYTFSKTITVAEKVSENGNYTKYITMVLSPGRDGIYGYGLNLTDLVSSGIFDLKNRSQVLDILKDRTVDMAGSDDLMEEISFCVGFLEEEEFKPFQGNLTAEQVSDVVALGDKYRISGTCYGSDHVDLVVISPMGSGGNGIEGTGPGYNMYNLSLEDHRFSKKILVDKNADIGFYIAMVLSTGINEIYDGIETGNLTEGLKKKYGDLTERAQSQLIAIIEDATIDEAGSDDILWQASLKIESPYVRLNPVEDVHIGEMLEVTGTTNREEGYSLVITVKGPVELIPQISKVKNGNFSAEFDTSSAMVGYYTVRVDDGEGNIDEATVEILEPLLLTAELDKSEVKRGDIVNVSGEASGIDIVDIVVIGPRGLRRMPGSFSSKIALADGIRFMTVEVAENNTFKAEIRVPEEVYTGVHYIMVLSPGEDGVYGATTRTGGGLFDAVFDYIASKGGSVDVLLGKSTEQLIDIIAATTFDAPDSDDLFSLLNFTAATSFGDVIKLNPIAPVYIAEPLIVNGTAELEDGSVVFLSTNPLVGLSGCVCRVQGGKFQCTFDTSNGVVGRWIMRAEDIDGNIDTEPFELLAAVPVSTEQGIGRIKAVEYSETIVEFDMPRCVVIGEKVDVRGTTPASGDLDIVIDDILMADDLPIRDYEFEWEWNTRKPLPNMGAYTPGVSVIKAYLKCHVAGVSVGDYVRKEDKYLDPDGVTGIWLSLPGLIAVLKGSSITKGDSLIVQGYAMGANTVDIIIIGPKGLKKLPTSFFSEDAVADGLFFTSAEVPDVDYAFEKVIRIPEDADFGDYRLLVLTPGRDGSYALTMREEGGLFDALLDYGWTANEFVGRNQSHLW